MWVCRQQTNMPCVNSKQTCCAAAAQPPCSASAATACCKAKLNQLPLHAAAWPQAMSSNYFLWIAVIVAVLAVMSKMIGAI